MHSILSLVLSALKYSVLFDWFYSQPIFLLDVYYERVVSNARIPNVVFSTLSVYLSLLRTQHIVIIAYACAYNYKLSVSVHEDIIIFILLCH